MDDQRCVPLINGLTTIINNNDENDNSSFNLRKIIIIGGLQKEVDMLKQQAGTEICAESISTQIYCKNDHAKNEEKSVLEEDPTTTPPNTLASSGSADEDPRPSTSTISESEGNDTIVTSLRFEDKNAEKNTATEEISKNLTTIETIIGSTNTMEKINTQNSTIHIDTIPRRNFSTITSTFATKAVGDPKITIYSGDANDNDSNSGKILGEKTVDKERLEEKNNEIDEKNAEEWPDGESIKVEYLTPEDGQNIVRTIPIVGSIYSKNYAEIEDEIEVDMEEEIDATAYSEHLYSSIAGGSKLFDRPLIEDVIPEESELDEEDKSLKSTSKTEKMEATKINYGNNGSGLEGLEYQLETLRQSQKIDNLEKIKPEMKISVDKESEFSELVSRNCDHPIGSDPNLPDYNLAIPENTNIAESMTKSKIDKFEDSPLFQPNVLEDAAESQEKTTISPREAFFQENIAQQLVSSKCNPVEREPRIEPRFYSDSSEPGLKEAIKESNNIPLQFSSRKYEEIVAQRITDSALLNGIAEAASASRFFEDLENSDKNVEIETKNRRKSESKFEISKNLENDMVIPIRTEGKSLGKSEPSGFKDTAVDTCHVTTRPKSIVHETEEELVKNFDNLLNEYQSQPTSPQFARREVPIERTIDMTKLGQAQESINSVLLEQNAIKNEHQKSYIKEWEVWNNPDVGLPDYGHKLLTNGFVIEKEVGENVRDNITKVSEKEAKRKTLKSENRPEIWRKEEENILRHDHPEHSPMHKKENVTGFENQAKEGSKDDHQHQDRLRRDLLIQQGQKDPTNYLETLTISTAAEHFNRGTKSPTPAFGSLHRQNLLQNQYQYDASSLSPRTLSRINHLNVIMETNNEKDGGEVIHSHPVFVKDTSKYWYKPNISREEAISMLKQKPPGTFIVRDSNSFPGAFGLALKVARPPPNAIAQNGDESAELVRHFLIEPSPKGVKLKGCANEPVFGTLAALVYQHSITPLALPCKLLLPEYDPALSAANEFQQRLDSNQALLERGAACNVTYLCSMDTESLTGPEALRRSATWGLEDLTRGGLRAIPVHFKVSAQGITLTDNTRSQFFRRHYPANLITYAGIDPENRVFDNNNCCQLPPCYVLQAPIFGFVARKLVVGGSVENACHVFAELDPDQPASAVIRFITNVMMPQAKSQQHANHHNYNQR